MDTCAVAAKGRDFGVRTLSLLGVPGISYAFILSSLELVAMMAMINGNHPALQDRLVLASIIAGLPGSIPAQTMVAIAQIPVLLLVNSGLASIGSSDSSPIGLFGYLFLLVGWLGYSMIMGIQFIFAKQLYQSLFHRFCRSTVGG